MRKTLVLTALLVAAAVQAPSAATSQTEPASISAICAFEFAAAADAAAALTPTEPAEPEEAGAATPSPGASSPAVVGEDAPGAPPRIGESLDAAVRSCASLDEWIVAAQLYPDALSGHDAQAVLAERCADPATGLSAYATCGSLAIALATPAPTPAATATPRPTPQPTAAPVQRDDTTTARPTKDGGSGERKTKRSPRVRVSKSHVATIPTASEIVYFDIKGASPASLLRANQRRGRRHCGDHGAIACVLLTWSVDVTKRADADRRCIIGKARTTLRSKVFLPRWVGRGKAPADLRSWWRSVLLASAVHEARHIAIQQRHLADYRKAAKGKPCGSATILLNRHMKAANKAQAAFDRVEYTKPLPPLPSSLTR